MSYTVPIGPYHPLLEEPEFFTLKVEGERVVDMDIRIGYNHRGIEKLALGKTWEQDTFLVERVCGICSNSHPLAYVNSVEDLLELEIPERAKYIRCVVAELERLHSHLLWAGLAGHFIGYNTVFMWAWKYREPVLDMFERISGNRNHYAMMKIGGVRKDVLKKDIPDFIDLLDELTQKNDMLTKAVIDDPVLHARLKGVGVLSKKDAIDYAVLGPTARGSGYDIDVRRDEPYAAYDMLDWDVVVLQEGDVFAKAAVRLLENVESIRIIRQCLEKLQELPEGDFFTPVEEFPIGEGIGHAEAPRGEVFHYVRSDGSNNPIRHKIRAPTFQNLPSFKASCIGETVADVALITASIDPCYCCTERMVAVDVDNGQKLFDGQELIRLSQEKTERMRQKMKG